MMETAPDETMLLSPTPSWLIAFVVVFGYVLLLYGLDSVVGFQLLRPVFAPATALGGAVAYWAFLWTMDLRDPRIWNDRSRFTEYVRDWANAAAQPMPSSERVEALRRQVKLSSGIVLAQQGGLVAGAGVGVTLLDHGGFLAIVGFGATMAVIGLAMRRWLVGRE